MDDLKVQDLEILKGMDMIVVLEALVKIERMLEEESLKGIAFVLVLVEIAVIEMAVVMEVYEQIMQQELVMEVMEFCMVFGGT